MPKFTISMIKMMNEMDGGHFFERDKMKSAGETLKSFKVIHHGNRVFVERKRRAGQSSPRWEFNPSNGSLKFDSYIQG